ncbi:coiled-coil alpha-helical rod protein 1 isoform X2 [Cebus imitator]|uniref:coiled-coil alpha-helical rod protein 1 isoform X2 n=1 Tax=Cebus imitator TaxID=2715852 RepID=UPI001896DB3F|nr:coiled-coil alpha-helical rod protein 1 isoform X2 [Cebus imitator]
MWPHSPGARPWASSLIGKDPRVMAWWCLDGLPPGLSEPWREFWRWRSRPLHCVPPFSPLARSSRDHRNLRRRVKALPRILKGNIYGWRQNLEPSNNVKMFPPSGSTGLIPPSHFQTRPLSTLPKMAPTWLADIPLVQPPGYQDVSERRTDTQRPQVTMWERDVASNRQEPGQRGRCRELEGSQALSQQAELISRQLQELRRLEEEVRLLRETSLQQKMRLEAQAMELEALARAEKAGRAEAEGLRAALAGAEVVRKNMEEGSQRELEEVQRLHQEQAHQEALSSLTSKAEGLEKSLSSLETRRSGEAKELAEAQREAELLRKQLSKTQDDLEAQVTLVENLRKYVGEQVPPEVHSQTWVPERQKLLETVQHLQEDRDGLHATAELLQVRVQSLTHILALQEEELTRKVQPSDSLEPEFTRKCQSLLNRWREKVFALMVQLKAQELEHSDSVKQLKGQMASLQEQVTAQSQEQAILQRSLQDKAAEAEVERMGAKALQLELSRAQEARRWWQQQTASAEEQLRLVVNAVSSSQIWLESTMAKVEQAAARLPSLSNRLSYAVRKVHTIQGLMARKLAVAQLRQESCPLPPPATDVSLELQQLREERNRLDAELQLSARLIQQEVGRAREQGEAERQQLSKVAQQLEQELQQTQESLASLGLQLDVARQGQQESTKEAASLRQELTQQQELYGQALQEKVAEVETRLREQLSDTERRLNEARREHAKAVVSLRQIQRKAAQEKERSQELRRLQEEARKEEGQRLARRLQELERDKNLMLATLQQEGLLSHYKQQRLLAVLPSLLDKKKSVVSSSRPLGCSASVPVAAAVPTRESIKGSLSVLLDDLQGLSEAISKEEAICQGHNLDRCSSSNPQMSS